MLGNDPVVSAAIPTSTTESEVAILCLVGGGGQLTPNFGICPFNGLTGFDIENLKLKVQRNTNLVLSRVLANVLAGDVVRSLCDLGTEDTRAIAGEDGFFRGGDGVIIFRKVSAVQGTEVTDFELSALALLIPSYRVQSKRVSTHPGDAWPAGPSSQSKQQRGPHDAECCEPQGHEP